MKIILASTSPRRRELLNKLNIDFSVASAEIDEAILSNETPTEYIRRMVSEKANAFQNKLATQVISLDDSPLSLKANQRILVLTSDTIGVMPNKRDILIKPKDKEDAFLMWSKMSGTQHFVWTAVQASVLHIESSAIEKIWSEQIIESTNVEFIHLFKHDMESYWMTGEPLDKAGGYAIQGKAGAWVNRIEGSYSNVVGLPLAQTKQLIDKVLNSQSE